MRVLIDIAHPAHIHYFRNFSKIFEQRGNECLFTLRDKGIIVELAKYYNLNYRIRSRKERNKAYYLLCAIKNVYKIARDFKPDLFLDMGTIVSAPVSKLLKKPYIAFDDTEASVKTRMLHMPFTDTILTPSTFLYNLGYKQIRINSLMEILYLHDNYFTKDSRSLMPYLEDLTNYVLIRFVSWEAHHDKGNKGISGTNKMKLIHYLETKYKVIISSENANSKIPEKNRFLVPSYLMHQLIAHARIVITEGATVASEAVLLGIPTLYINPIQNGYSIEQQNNNLLFALNSDEKLFDEIHKVEKLLNDSKNLKEFQIRSLTYKKSKIDVTSFLLWFVENWPQSFSVMKKNPNYQEMFK